MQKSLDEATVINGLQCRMSSGEKESDKVVEILDR
jgi:hypothetical protein